MATPTPTPTNTITPTTSLLASPTPTPSNTPTSALDDPVVYTVSSTGEVHRILANKQEEWERQIHDNSVVATSVAVALDGNIYTTSSDKTVRNVNFAGSVIWEYTAEDDVTSVSVDPSGNIIAGSFGKVYKLTSSGAFVWSYLVGSFVRSVANDSAGNVYFGADDWSVRKLDSSGNQDWSYTGHSGAITKIVVDHNVNVYSASKDNEIHKIDINGNFRWSFSLEQDVTSLAVDNNENLYVGARDGVLRKINHRGLLI